MEGEDYESFDSLAYIKRKYSQMNELIAVPLREMHQVWDALVKDGRKDLRVLDFGCGPVPVYLCSAPRASSEIVFAEYGKGNRDILQMWLDKDVSSPDYTPFFKFVVQELEGITNEIAVLERQDELRRLVKAVVPCDCTKDPPIDHGFDGPYDIINCSLCLAVASTTLEEYSLYLGRLIKMLRFGGRLFLNSIEAHNEADTFSYPTGTDNSQFFNSLSMNEDSLTFVLNENGCKADKICHTYIDSTPGARNHVSPEASAMIFVSATKIKE